MSARRRESSASMAKAAMPLDELGQWLLSRPGRPPAATNLSMLDGYVTAIVVGPVSFDPRELVTSPSSQVCGSESTWQF
jgi:uncharacterized protein